MDWGALFKDFVGSLPIIRNAWPAVLGLIIVALGVGWLAGRFMFGERIETLKSRIDKRDEMIAELRGRAGIEKGNDESSLISESNLTEMRKILTQDEGSVIIRLDSSSYELQPLCRQLEDIFNSAGWNVDSDVPLDKIELKKPITIITYKLSNLSSSRRVIDAIANSGKDFDLVKEDSVNRILSPPVIFLSSHRA